MAKKNTTTVEVTPELAALLGELIKSGVLGATQVAAAAPVHRDIDVRINESADAKKYGAVSIVKRNSPREPWFPKCGIHADDVRFIGEALLAAADVLEA